MDSLSVKFFDKEYTIPTDVVTYVGLVDFTNKIRDSLVLSFKNQVWPNVENLEADNFMVSVINQQVSKFISKLLDNEIYDKTANDYLLTNKGYNLFLDTKEKILRQIISIRKEKLDVYRSGVQDAIYKKEASVTGLDFGILSGSFVNHMIYAYMDASKQTKQEQEALKVYNQEIAELDKVAQSYDQREQSYIFDNVIPAMNTIFTFFAYELLDKYVSDLIRVGKFDKEALNYINLERSNDLLKNLNLSNNKKSIIESAFVACPFNVAVYMQAMKYDLLDYDSFLTANTFKQSEEILSFLKDSIGIVSYPKYTHPNIHSAKLLGRYTNKSVNDVLYQHTAYYADAVVSEYSNIIKTLKNSNYCTSLLNELSEDEIIAGEKTSKQLSHSIVTRIAPNDVWNSLVEKCGHKNLFDKLLNLLPVEKTINSKSDYDSYLIQELFLAIENVRKELEKNIKTKRANEEVEHQKIEIEKRKKRIKTTIIGSSILALIIFVISLPSIITSVKESNRENTIDGHLQEITDSLERKIESSIDDDIVIDFSYETFMGYEDSLMWSFEIKMTKFEEFRKAGGQDEALLLEIMNNCEIIEEIIEKESDSFDFTIEIGDEYIDVNNYDGSVDYGDLSSYETFYYDARGYTDHTDRYLYSSDTEYVIVEEK